MSDKETRVEVELPNDRSIHMITNNDRTVNPLIVVFPQWSKGSIIKMPKARQNAIYDQFAEDVSVAFEKLLREVP